MSPRKKPEQMTPPKFQPLASKPVGPLVDDIHKKSRARFATMFT